MVIEEFDIEKLLGSIESSDIEETLETEKEKAGRFLQDKSISFIVLKVDHKEFNFGSPSFLVSILGKPTISYVKKACEFVPKTKEVDENADVVSEIKPLLTDKEWTIVLFSDTPLLTTTTIVEAFLYAENNDLNVCKLKRGYIFKTEYIKRVDKIFEVESLNQEGDDYFEVKTLENLVEATAIMKDRIVKHLMAGGVQIIDPLSTYIESQVVIGKGTTIYPNVALMGSTQIGTDSIVGFGCTLKHAVIGNKCNIQNSMVTNSVVLDSTLVESSRIENNSLVEKNCVVKHYSILSSAKIGKNSKVSWSKIKGVEVKENSNIEN